MKIEKINDNQIKCTLNKSDLASREIKISELAYGTEKAKNLFRDMMQQASYEFGFEAEDIPLMIEAIPVSPDCIVLVITKVDDPEELDTRFSKFAPSVDDEELEYNESFENTASAESEAMLDMFRNIKDTLAETGVDNFIPLPQFLTPKKEKTKVISPQQEIPDLNYIIIAYSFGNLEVVIKLSKIVKGMYNGKNSLYKSEQDKLYYLVLNKSNDSPDEFNKMCSIFSEYGRKEKASYASTAHYDEHFKIIIKNNALQKLVNL